MKTAFVTSVQLGLSCIEEVLKNGGNFNLLITIPDNKARKKSGRIYLDEVAKKYNIPLLKANNVNDQIVIEKLKELEIDWLFIIGWSQIAKKELLDTPKKGCIGMHPTLLPKGRGRAAIPWAIIKGLDKTGVTMFKLDEGVDTGDIIEQIEIELDNKTTATELYDKVNDAHVKLINKVWPMIVENKVTLKKQDDSLATIWEGRKPSDGELFSDMTMEEADRLVRATTKPYPGAFYIKDNVKTIIWKAKPSKDKGYVKLKDGYLKILEFEKVDYEK